MAATEVAAATAVVAAAAEATEELVAEAANAVTVAAWRRCGRELPLSKPVIT